jgi:hypothetical protein
MLHLFTFAPVRRAALALANVGIFDATLSAAVDADTALVLGTATDRREAFRDLLADARSRH